MAEFTVSELNKENITNLYLYGELEQPTNLVDDDLIRRPDQFNRDGELINPQATVNVDAVQLMETGPGRFAVPAQFELVKRFFDPNFNPTPGEYLSVSKSVLNDLYFGLERIFWNMRQVNYDDGRDNLTERAYIWNNMSFQIADDSDIKFIIEPDGTKRIENFRAHPFTRNPENFDFTTEGIAGIVANNFLEPRIDPSGIGRTVNINFDNIDLIEPIEVYTENDFYQDLKPSQITEGGVVDLLTNGNIEDIETRHFINLATAGSRILPEANGFVGELFEQGIIRFIDDNSKPIFYGTTGNDTLRASDVSESSFPLQAINGANGIVLLGGQGNDTISGDFRGGISTDDILVGHEGNDSLNGRKGEDLAIFSGKFEDYDYSISEDGETITLNHIRGTQTDGSDTLRNIEFAEFQGEQPLPLPINAANTEPGIISQVAAATGSAPRIIPLPLEDGVEQTQYTQARDTTTNPNTNDLPTPPYLSLTAPVSMLDGDIDYTLNISPYEPSNAYNIVYLLDTSATMSGEKLQQAKDAYSNLTNYLIDNQLAEKINFGVVSFGKQTTTLQSNLNAEQAITSVQNLSSVFEGTLYDQGLSQAKQFLVSSPLNQESVTNIAYFATDSKSGNPTRGDNNTYRIYAQSLRNSAVVRAFGINDDPFHPSTVVPSQINFVDSNDGVLIDSASDLSNALLRSGLAGSVEAVNILLDGEVVETLTPEQLTDSPIGLTYEGSIEGLDVSIDAENLVTAEVIFTPESNLANTTVEHTVTAGESQTLDADGNPIDQTENDTGNDNPFERELSGSDGDDQITLGYVDLGANGGAGRDLIIGNQRDNILEGGDGDDTILGHGGNDTITPGAGNDNIDGGDGIDTVIYSDVVYQDNSSVFLRQAANSVNYSGSDLLTDVEFIQFSDVRISSESLEITPVLEIAEEIISITEGDTGNTTAEVRLNLTTAAPVEITVNYSTADLNALAGIDYQASSGQITIAPGETSASLNLEIIGDLEDEANESFTINLSELTGATFEDNQTESSLVATIANDDTPVPLTLVGDAGDDLLEGDIFGDYLAGQAGNDTLVGDAGNDTLDGGANYDLLVESANVDFTLTDTQLTGLGTDSITNIEAARLTGGVDNNLLDAGLVANMNVTLVGGDGNDSLYSGTKADILYGNLGNDRLESGGGWDRLNGNSGNDVLFAGDGNDTLNGSRGNDTLKGEGGNDIINGGDGIDRIVGNANVNFTLTDTQLTGRGTDTITNIETAHLTAGVGNNRLDAGLVTKMNVTLVGGDGDDSLDSGAKADVLYGNHGNDRLESRGGNDTLFGNLGNDALFAGDGNDTLRGGGDNDTLQGENGNDLINGEGGFDLLMEIGNVDFILTDTQLTGLGTDTLSNLEAAYLTGGVGNNRLDARGVKQLEVTLDGGAGHDNLIGSDHDDLLLGSDGGDRLAGKEGDDTLNGGSGNDTLYGDGGNDFLDGGDGDDLLYGQFGNDTITGGAGADLFVLKSAWGTDVIEDFMVGVDSFGLLTSLEFSDLAISDNGAQTASLIRDTTDNNLLLAVVNGVSAAELTTADFVNL